MQQQYPHLLSPLSLRGVRYENRVLAAPMPAASAFWEGRLTPEGLDSYETRARGGFAQVTVDEGIPNRGWGALAEAIRSHGTVAAVRLNAIPPVEDSQLEPGTPPMGRVEMTERWMDGMARSASSARELGFQGVYVTGAALEDAVSLCRHIREGCGEGFLLQLEITPTEGELSQSAVQDQLRQMAGYVDLLAVGDTGEGAERTLAIAERLRVLTGIPVGAVVDVRDPEIADRAIAVGRCDCVFLKYQQLADPDYVRRAARNRGDEIVPSLQEVSPAPAGYSAANPWAGRELRWRCAPRPTGKRRVMVVGGGPGGLYAAYTAAQRGHDVILVEAASVPGGMLRQEGGGTPMGGLLRSLLARCTAVKVKFQLSTTATRDYVAGMSPDALIFAAGREQGPLAEQLRPVVPQFRVIEGCRTPADLARVLYEAGVAAMDIL